MMDKDHLPATVFTMPPTAPLALGQAVAMLKDESLAQEVLRRRHLLLNAQSASGDFVSSVAMLEQANFTKLFLDNSTTGVEFGHGTYNLLQEWSKKQNQPSLSSILLSAGEYFGVSEQDKAFLAVAGILGSEETDLEYHNAEHNLKVSLMAIRLCAASTDLTAHDKTKLMIAAAIHDLGHDGKGNMENGVHVPYRLEKQSFELAKPFLKQMGMSDDDLEDIKVMILGTDVSPMESPDAPQRRVTEGKNFPPELKRLENNPKLLKMTRMLAIADIACSSSLHPDQTDYETRNVAQEVGKDASSMKYEEVAKFFGFFAQKCGGILHTVPEARFVFEDNHKHVHAQMMSKTGYKH